MGLPNQLGIMSALTGESVDTLINNALANSTNQAEAAKKLNISRQALSKRLQVRERQRAARRPEATER